MNDKRLKDKVVIRVGVTVSATWAIGLKLWRYSGNYIAELNEAIVWAESHSPLRHYPDYFSDSVALQIIAKRMSGLFSFFWASLFPPRPKPSWTTRWIAKPVAYLFPKANREEWIGDLMEQENELIKDGYPRWLVNLISLGKTMILVWSAIEMRVLDLISRVRGT
jgi:hypothetical protein